MYVYLINCMTMWVFLIKWTVRMYSMCICMYMMRAGVCVLVINLTFLETGIKTDNTISSDLRSVFPNPTKNSLSRGSTRLPSENMHTYAHAHKHALNTSMSFCIPTRLSLGVLYNLSLCLPVYQSVFLWQPTCLSICL